MRAVTFHEHGGPEVLRYEEVDRPVPGSGEVLLEVHAVSINPGPDTMTRERGFGYNKQSLPHVSGTDPAGRVAEVGEGVTEVSIDDRVVVYPVLRCGICEFCRRGLPANYCRNFKMFGVATWGGRADYVVVPQESLVRLPDTVSFEAAAALPVAYITTWHGLLDRAQLSSEDTLLVVGAGGGTGVAAVQIARHVGARTIAVTGSSWKAERLTALGVDEVLSYRDPNWNEAVRKLSSNGVTVAFDNCGNQTWSKSLDCVDRGGRFVCSGATTGAELTVDVRQLYREQITMVFNVQGTRENLETLVALVAAGQLEPIIDHRLPLSETLEAEQLLASGKHFGKIVLVPDAHWTES
jgi:NADPH:quinone reductase-like Zn-dependent oxidoreductase